MERRGGLQVMAQLLAAAVVADRGLHRAALTQSSSSSSSGSNSAHSGMTPGLDLSRATGLRFADAIAPHARLLAAALMATVAPASCSVSSSSTGSEEEPAAHVNDSERRAGRGAALEASALLLLLRRSGGCTSGSGGSGSSGSVGRGSGGCTSGGGSGSSGLISLLPSVTIEKLLASLVDVALGSCGSKDNDDGSVSARGALCLAVGSHYDESSDDSSSSALLLRLLPRLLGALSPDNGTLASTQERSTADAAGAVAVSSSVSPHLFRNALALLSQLMALPVALLNAKNPPTTSASTGTTSPLAHAVGALANHATALLRSTANKEGAPAATSTATEISSSAQAASLIVAAARVVQSGNGSAQEVSASDSLNRATIVCDSLLGAPPNSQSLSLFEPLSDGPGSEKRLKVEQQPKIEQQQLTDGLQSPLPALLETLLASSFDSEAACGNSVVAAASELVHAMTLCAAEVDANVESINAAVDTGIAAPEAWALARVFQALAPAMPTAPPAESNSSTGVSTKGTSPYWPLLAAAVDAAPAHPSPALLALVASHNRQKNEGSDSSDPRPLLNALLSASLASSTSDGATALAGNAARETAARCLSDLLHKLPPKGNSVNNSGSEWSLAAWVAALVDDTGSQDLHHGVFADAAFNALSASPASSTATNTTTHGGDHESLLQSRARALLWLCRGALSRAPPLPSPIWKQLAGLLGDLLCGDGSGRDDDNSTDGNSTSGSAALSLQVAQSLDLLVNDNPITGSVGSRYSSSASRLGLWRQRLWSTLAEPLLNPASPDVSPSNKSHHDAASTAPLVAIAKLTAHASAAVVGVGTTRGATVATALVRALARADRLAGGKVAASNEEAEVLRSAALEGLVAMARLAEKQQLAQSNASAGEVRGSGSGGNNGEDAVVSLGSALSKHAGTLLELLPRLAGSAAVPRNRIVVSSSSSSASPSPAPASSSSSSLSSSSSPATRARALVLLHLLSTPGSAAALPSEVRVPHQAHVTRALGLALDDPVSAVRRLAATLRNEWAVL